LGPSDWALIARNEGLVNMEPIIILNYLSEFTFAVQQKSAQQGDAPDLASPGR